MITIWDEVFEKLWATKDIRTMKLAVALLSDRYELDAWWYRGGMNRDLKPTGICHHEFYGGEDMWDKWTTLREELQPIEGNSIANRAYLKKSYEDWERRQRKKKANMEQSSVKSPKK